MFPQQNKRRALQLETSAAEAEPRELRESASFQMKQLLGHIREERQNRADGKRKAQGDQLTTKGWAHFHCKLFSQFHISFLFSFQFRCVSCSSVLVLRIDCCIHGRLLARRKHLQQLKWGKLLSGLLLPFGGTKNFTGKQFYFKANFILLDAVFILTQLHMTYCRPAEMEDNCGAPWWRSLSSDLQQMNGTLRGH